MMHPYAFVPIRDGRFSCALSPLSAVAFAIVLQCLCGVGVFSAVAEGQGKINFWSRADDAYKQDYFDALNDVNEEVAKLAPGETLMTDEERAFLGEKYSKMMAAGQMPPPRDAARYTGDTWRRMGITGVDLENVFGDDPALDQGETENGGGDGTDRDGVEEQETQDDMDVGTDSREDAETEKKNDTADSLSDTSDGDVVQEDADTEQSDAVDTKAETAKSTNDAAADDGGESSTDSETKQADLKKNEGRVNRDSLDTLGTSKVAVDAYLEREKAEKAEAEKKTMEALRKIQEDLENIELGRKETDIEADHLVAKAEAEAEATAKDVQGEVQKAQLEDSIGDFIGDIAEGWVGAAGAGFGVGFAVEASKDIFDDDDSREPAAEPTETVAVEPAASTGSSNSSRDHADRGKKSPGSLRDWLDELTVGLERAPVGPVRRPAVRTVPSYGGQSHSHSEGGIETRPHPEGGGGATSSGGYSGSFSGM